MTDDQQAVTPLRNVTDRLRVALSDRFRANYDRLVDRLRALGMGGESPKLGDLVEEFALPTAGGRILSLAEMLADGPVVLNFIRGPWCPFCRATVGALQNSAGAIRAAGARLALVTPEAGGLPLTMQQEMELDFDVLVDLDNGLALALGLVFQVPMDLRREYLDIGRDLARHYGNDSWFLPVPATFVLDRDRRVQFAHCDPDFRNRAEPDDIVAVIRALST